MKQFELDMCLRNSSRICIRTRAIMSHLCTFVLMPCILFGIVSERGRHRHHMSGTGDRLEIVSVFLGFFRGYLNHHVEIQARSNQSRWLTTWFYRTDPFTKIAVRLHSHKGQTFRKIRIT
ncbi:hypothetical protein ABKN59_010249 [Abortiporus biennis]